MPYFDLDETAEARAEMDEFEASAEAYGQSFSPFMDDEDEDE